MRSELLEGVNDSSWFHQEKSKFQDTAEKVNGHHKFTWVSLGFLGGSEDKESACNAKDPGLIPGSERLSFTLMLLANRIFSADLHSRTYRDELYFTEHWAASSSSL